MANDKVIKQILEKIESIVDKEWKDAKPDLEKTFEKSSDKGEHEIDAEPKFDKVKDGGDHKMEPEKFSTKVKGQPKNVTTPADEQTKAAGKVKGEVKEAKANTYVDTITEYIKTTAEFRKLAESFNTKWKNALKINEVSISNTKRIVEAVGVMNFMVKKTVSATIDNKDKAGFKKVYESIKKDLLPKLKLINAQMKEGAAKDSNVFEEEFNKTINESPKAKAQREQIENSSNSKVLYISEAAYSTVNWLKGEFYSNLFKESIAYKNVVDSVLVTK